MSEELVPYYNRELSYIRRLGAEFAEAHPKIAARLALGPHGTEDPHVERLIEAVRLSQRPDTPQARRRLPGNHRGDARRPLSALPGARPVDGHRPGGTRPRPGRVGRRLRDSPRDDPGGRLARRRSLPFPHVLSGHALSDRGGGGEPDGPAVRGAGSARGRARPSPCCGWCCGASRRT